MLAAPPLRLEGAGGVDDTESEQVEGRHRACIVLIITKINNERSMKLFTKNQRASVSPSKIRGGTPPPPGGRWHEVPEEGEWAGALMLPRQCMP